MFNLDNPDRDWDLPVFSDAPGDKVIAIYNRKWITAGHEYTVKSLPKKKGLSWATREQLAKLLAFEEGQFIFWHNDFRLAKWDAIVEDELSQEEIEKA